MKIFISWSGSTSHQVAETLRDWLPSVIQSLEPWLSYADIEKGVRWNTEIVENLQQSQYGIICVTKQSLAAPWLNFEAGALSNAVDKSRVAPFLFGISRRDVVGPLSHFQSTIHERNDVLKLLHSINSVCASPLTKERLDEAYGIWWPMLDSELQKIEPTADSNGTAALQDRTDGEVLSEVLQLVRTQQQIIATPEAILPPQYIERIVRRLQSPSEAADAEKLSFHYRRLAVALQEYEKHENPDLREVMTYLERLGFAIDDLTTYQTLSRDTRDTPTEDASGGE